MFNVYLRTFNKHTPAELINTRIYLPNACLDPARLVYIYAGSY